MARSTKSVRPPRSTKSCARHARAPHAAANSIVPSRPSLCVCATVMPIVQRLCPACCNECGGTFCDAASVHGDGASGGLCKRKTRPWALASCLRGASRCADGLSSPCHSR
eukprot:6896750-Prymnesium_polylepis.2